MLLARNTNDRPMVGISAVVAGLFVFSLQDIAIKYFSSDYSVLQIVVIRGICAVMVIGSIVAFNLGFRGFLIRNMGLTLGKGFLGFASYLAYYLAVASLPLADVVAITFSMPIVVTVLSAVLLGENVGVRRWSAVVIGFLGVLIVVGPSGKFANIAVAFAALASLTYALSTVMSRWIGSEDSAWTVTFFYTIAHLMGGLIVSILVLTLGSGIQSDHPSLAFLFRPWAIHKSLDLTIMLALGANAALGFYLLNKAYLSAPASVVAPFEYTYIIWAVLFGYFLWSEVPDFYTVTGVSILIVSNLYIAHREIVVRRKQQTA